MYTYRCIYIYYFYVYYRYTCLVRKIQGIRGLGGPFENFDSAPIQISRDGNGNYPSTRVDWNLRFNGI